MKFSFGYCDESACAVIGKGDLRGLCECFFAYVDAGFKSVCLLAGYGRRTGEEIRFVDMILRRKKPVRKLTGNILEQFMEEIYKL